MPRVPRAVLLLATARDARPCLISTCGSLSHHLIRRLKRRLQLCGKEWLGALYPPPKAAAIGFLAQVVHFRARPLATDRTAARILPGLATGSRPKAASTSAP